MVFQSHFALTKIVRSCAWIIGFLAYFNCWNNQLWLDSSFQLLLSVRLNFSFPWKWSSPQELLLVQEMLTHTSSYGFQISLTFPLKLVVSESNNKHITWESVVCVAGGPLETKRNSDEPGCILGPMALSDRLHIYVFINGPVEQVFSLLQLKKCLRDNRNHEPHKAEERTARVLA